MTAVGAENNGYDTLSFSIPFARWHFPHPSALGLKYPIFTSLYFSDPNKCSKMIGPVAEENECVTLSFPPPRSLTLRPPPTLHPKLQPLHQRLDYIQRMATLVAEKNEYVRL